MQATCLRQTELPHTSRLFSDFLYDFDRVKHLYEDGRTVTGYPAERRAAMVAALERLNGPSEALHRLSRDGTVAIVTGQQVGLFSGPAYTVYKALTAVKMARQMTDRGTPAVPVFWLATEDHDFAEVNHAWVFDKDATPVCIEVQGPTAGDQPVGNVPIESWHVGKLESALAGFPFGEEIVGLVREAYTPGRTMGAAFHDLLRRVLRDYGLVFIDPLDPEVRKVAAPLLREAVAAAPDLGRSLLDRNAHLASAGYHAQVHVEPATSLFFLLEGDRRIGLKRQNGDYIAKDRRYTPAELARMADRISPNALLRPVMQDYLLPTAAYIGGPAELAYLAQSQVVYRTLLGGMPTPASRCGFTLLDHRTGKLMDRYGLRMQDFFHGEEPLRERIAARLVPPELEARFRATNEQAEALLSGLQDAVGGFDRTLGATAAKSRAKIMHQLQRIEAKVARESMRRNERAAAEAAYLYGTIFPHKHLQERFYTILPFLARHGLNLVDRIYEAVNLGCPDHIVLRLDS